MCQGGDITNGDGTGGESIYGRVFEDESSGLELEHSTVGQLSMANAGSSRVGRPPSQPCPCSLHANARCTGPNTNGSQFFITINPSPWLDGKHVVFGEMVEGFDVLGKMEMVGTKSGKTQLSVMVTDCGDL